MKLINESFISDRVVLRVLRAVQLPRKRGEWRGLPRRLVVVPAKPPWIVQGEMDPMDLSIRAAIATRSQFPFTRRQQPGGYMRFRFEDPIEGLVYLISHEWRHLWQYHNPDLPRQGRYGVGSGRGVFSELDADRYALECLTAWRKRARR